MAALPYDALQIGTACGMPGYSLIPSGSHHQEIYYARVVDPDGTSHSLDVGIALAERNGCDNINLAPMYETIDWCRQGLQRAATAGLPHGWVMKAPTQNGVYLWSPKGEVYQTYWDVASNFPGIYINTISCPWWLERRRLAEEVYRLPDGWTAVATSVDGYGVNIYDPVGNKYMNNAVSAGIAAGILRPLRVLRREGLDYQGIVRELHSRPTTRVMSSTKIANILDVGKHSFTDFLSGRSSTMNYDGQLKISQFFDMANNATALREAAVNAGVTDITRYETRMAEAHRARIGEGIYNYDLPQPTHRLSLTLGEYPTVDVNANISPIDGAAQAAPPAAAAAAAGGFQDDPLPPLPPPIVGEDPVAEV